MLTVWLWAKWWWWWWWWWCCCCYLPLPWCLRSFPLHTHEIIKVVRITYKPFISHLYTYTHLEIIPSQEFFGTSKLRGFWRVQPTFFHPPKPIPHHSTGGGRWWPLEVMRKTSTRRFFGNTSRKWNHRGTQHLQASWWELLGREKMICEFGCVFFKGYFPTWSV